MLKIFRLLTQKINFERSIRILNPLASFRIRLYPPGRRGSAGQESGLAS